MFSKQGKRRRRFTALGVALVAVLALTAMASAAQAAPRWKVNGAFLGNGATKSFNDAGGSAYFGFKGFATIRCQQHESAGVIEGTAGGVAGLAKEITWKFTECGIEGAPACEVFSPGQEPGTVQSNALKGKLTWTTEPSVAGEEVTAETGQILFDFVIEGCALGGEWPVSGVMVGRIERTAGTEGVTNVLNYSPSQPGTRLKVGPSDFFFLGSQAISLSSEESFGVEEG